MSGGEKAIEAALRKLLDALDAHATLRRESHLSLATVAMFDANDWELIRGAEAEAREVLDATPEADPLVPVGEVEKARADERAKVVEFVRTAEGGHWEDGEDDARWVAWTPDEWANAIEARFAPGTGDDDG